MTADEIEKLMGAQPVQEPRPAPEAVTAGSVVADAYRAMARGPVATGPDPEAVEALRLERVAADRAARMDGLQRERAALERRPGVRPIVDRLRQTQTPCGLLLGPTGTGKTTAMDWVAVRWPGYFIHARELASSERRHGLGEGYPPELRRARECRVLYLDDVGSEEQRDLGTLQELLDHRYRHGLAMFATSGLRSDELKAHLGAAYMRRLVDQHVKRDEGEWPVAFVDLFQAQLRSVP